MFTQDGRIAELGEELGRPLPAEMCFEIHPWEYDMVVGSMRDGRAHDLTLFIHGLDRPDELAVIRKPFFPKEAFRAPSGAARRGERLTEGALREGVEETGLDLALDRYLVRIAATFTCGDGTIDWTSHILEAHQTGGELDPIDTEEIAEAKWATVDELQGPIRQVLLETGWSLFRYRVALTDLTIETMCSADAVEEP